MADPRPTRRVRQATATSSFGVGRRESHDSSEFYARFQAPETTTDQVVNPVEIVEPCIHGDARDMAALPDASVALVVTSPPYFAGKQYEEDLGRGGVPATYLEYLGMLRDVFAECRRVLEPGGRMAVNVANLGRKPYRSLASDVIGILQDDLRLLLRGEVVWKKGEGASGSCAWGSFRSAANPVLRDLTERVVIASKGRFDRALTARERARRGLPHENTVGADEFMEATLDVWSLSPESARRVSHPAPFPVELPQRLIELYTYRGDVVLDPFMGSGTTLVAAARTGRRGVGYDTDAGYVELARRRLADEVPLLPEETAGEVPAARGARAAARELVEQAGFVPVRPDQRIGALGMTVDLVAADAGERPWYFDVSGGFTSTPGGLARAETLWRTLGRAGVLRAGGRAPVVLLTSELPRPGGEGDAALRAVGPAVVFDVVALLDPTGAERLRTYARGGAAERPLPGFWTEEEIGRL